MINSRKTTRTKEVTTLKEHKSRKALFFNSKTKYVKEVLVCKPSYFEVSYVINPWMKPGSVNKNLAQTQWQKLVESLLKLNIKVNIINQKKGLPDMVFAADQGIINDKEVILSNFHYPERQKETGIYKNWFQKKKYNLTTLPKGFYFEGYGESLWYGKKLLIGTGFRTSKKTIKYLKNILNKDVFELELINPFFYHLDTCLFPLNDEIIFYYPKAFSEKSINLLKKLTTKLIPINKSEAYNFAANSLPTDHHVIMQKGNKNLVSILQNLKYKTIELDLSEFMKAGGGIHCLISTLKEEYA